MESAEPSDQPGKKIGVGRVEEVETHGPQGLMAFKNWKECAWKNEYGTENGLIKVSLA